VREGRAGTSLRVKLGMASRRGSVDRYYFNHLNYTLLPTKIRVSLAPCAAERVAKRTAALYKLRAQASYTTMLARAASLQELLHVLH
jgi:hypothetical protein